MTKRFCYTDGQMILLPLKHKMLFGSFSNYAGEHNNHIIKIHAA